MLYKTFNVKEDKPTVELALANIEIEIERCRSEGVLVLKVIHGYGSHGTGGEIKRNLERWLVVKKKQGFIKDFVKGTEWPTSPKAEKIKKYCPDVLGDMELYFINPGYTLIVI